MFTLRSFNSIGFISLFCVTNMCQQSLLTCLFAVSQSRRTLLTVRHHHLNLPIFTIHLPRAVEMNQYFCQRTKDKIWSPPRQIIMDLFLLIFIRKANELIKRSYWAQNGVHTSNDKRFNSSSRIKRRFAFYYQPVPVYSTRYFFFSCKFFFFLYKYENQDGIREVFSIFLL